MDSSGRRSGPLDGDPSCHMVQVLIHRRWSPLSSGGQVAERMCPQLGRLDGAEPMQAAEGSACPPGPAIAHAAEGETYVCR